MTAWGSMPSFDDVVGGVSSADSSAGFSVTPSAMDSAIGSFGSTLADTSNIAGDLGGTVLEPVAFGGIGSPVADTFGQLTTLQNSALSSWSDGMSGVHDSLGTVLNSYVDTDQTVAESLGGDGSLETSVAAGSTPGASTDLPHLGLVNGKYGDPSGSQGSFWTDLGSRSTTLQSIDDGTLVPDPESRLGAYAATSGNPPGTVGASVHAAIGTIYGTMGTYGEEKIGRVFNSPEAIALYSQPADSPAGLRMAKLEYQYWSDVAKENPNSAGGELGTMASPNVRDWLQRHLFSQ